MAVWNNGDGGDREYSGGGGVVGGMIIIMRLLGRSVGRGLSMDRMMMLAGKRKICVKASYPPPTQISSSFLSQGCTDSDKQ